MLGAPPGTVLTIKGKLSMPGPLGSLVRCGRAALAPSAALPQAPRLTPARPVPAVLILHGSSGVDSRGDFYQGALNAAGIATLQIDMWEARGVSGISNRPQVPILTYPDAFAALAVLSQHPAIDARRIGVLGFSWGGVVSLAASEQLYAGMFGQRPNGPPLKFAAHVANYPVCYGANNPLISAPAAPAQIGTQYINLTGAPVLIQIGTEDDYDNGSAHCKALANAVNPGNGGVVQVAEYPGAYHAFDRLMVAVTAQDPFADEGSVFRTGVVPTIHIVPDVRQALAAQQRAVAFFLAHL